LFKRHPITGLGLTEKRDSECDVRVDLVEWRLEENAILPKLLLLDLSVTPCRELLGLV